MTDYYHHHFAAYHKKTFSIDPAPFLAPFAKQLAPGCKILDTGCGSGRDTGWLKNRGFLVTGFERSPGLAHLARENTGCRVIEGDFKTFDFSTLAVDAVICIGSLVHLPHKVLPDIITRISAALSHGEGLLFITLKQGTDSVTDSDKRTFYLWGEKEVTAMAHATGFRICNMTHTVSDVNTRWLGITLQKTS